MPERIVDGSRIAYDEVGSGPPLVLVHGLGGNRIDTWKHLVADLARDFRVVTVDLRGAGESETTPGPYSIDLLADDLDTLIGALELGQVVLVGHSMGGAICLTEAARRPDRVRAVVGAGATPTLTPEQRDGMRSRADTVEGQGMGAVAETVATNGTAPSFRARDPAAFQELVSMLAANDPDGYAALCRALVTMSVEELLPGIRAPVLLVAGELDKVSPPAVNEATAAGLADARVTVVEDCAHIIPWERPAELIAAMQGFLGRTG